MKTRQVVLLIVCALFMWSIQAIIIRHDTGPARYVVNADDYPAVFFLERQGNRKVCVATVIHQRWAITAAHCAGQTLLGDTLANGRRFAVEVGHRQREVDLLIIHPDFDISSSNDVDLALLRFRDASDFPAPVPLQSQDNELEQVISIVGWGFFGLGTTGRQYDDGVFRLAQNRITAAGRRLHIVFDDPRDRSRNSLQLEGMPGLGDSGGPAFIDSDTGLRLAGIAVGEIEDSNFSEEMQGKYGAEAIYERLSQHLQWIETVIGATLPFDS